MNGDVSIPPLRDLPPGRLAERREHLLFEITGEHESRRALVRPWPVRWPRPGRRRILVLVASALVVAVATASAISSVRDFVLDRGFIGLPPEGATPSAPESGEPVVPESGEPVVPESGELVVQWFGFTAPLSPLQSEPDDMVRAWLYADGRMIWDRRPHHAGSGTWVPEGANRFTTGYLEQRLTSEGVELVRSAVAELIDRNRALVDKIPAEDDPWWGGDSRRLALVVPKDFGSPWGVLAAPAGDRSARLLWSKKEVGWDGPLATPEQLSSLRRVQALLTDPASVLPPSAWAVREVRAYVPSHYAVCIETSPPKDVSHLLSMLPARAADLLRDKSRTGHVGQLFGNTRDDVRMRTLGRSVRYCFKLATEEAREVADALSGLDREPGWDSFTLAYRVAEAVGNLNPTWIWFEPYLPNGQYPFSGPFG